MGIIKKFRIKSFKNKNSIIEFKNITLSYGKRIILDNINFKISQGQIFGMLGPNGVGKSTIFNLITGLINPDSGYIKINGERLTGKWENNQFIGDSEEYIFNCLDGNCENGLGESKNLKGDHYKGSFENGKFHGKGIFTSANGEKYEGEYKNGLKYLNNDVCDRFLNIAEGLD